MLRWLGSWFQGDAASSALSTPQPPGESRYQTVSWPLSGDVFSRGGGGSGRRRRRLAAHELRWCAMWQVLTSVTTFEAPTDHSSKRLLLRVMENDQLITKESSQTPPLVL